MRTKCNLDESAVIRDYKQFGCARACAEKYGVSNQMIYRILIRNEIPRKKPKEDKERVFVSNCRSKYCPALIVMLRTVCELSNNEIAAIIKAKNISSVCNIISRRGLQKEKPVQAIDVDMNKLEAEYIAGASTYELGKKYNVNHATISKWMRERGHNRGKFYSDEETHICKVCGRQFNSRNRNAKYCSKKCKNRINTERYPPGYVRRAHKYGVAFDRSITLKAVYDRDSGVCKLCGGECDFSDINNGVVGKTYPSIDHIVSLKNGGSHTWGNVQLAHHYCNSVKREFELDKVHDKVMLYAKKQAITHKRA